MTSQESTLALDINVHFVVPNDYEDENNCGDIMWQAFNKCNEFGLQPEWVAEKLCHNIQLSKKEVFIMEEFKGNLFENLRNSRCSRIVSPNCLLYCFINQVSIPGGTSPIYTTAMTEMCICASGLSIESKDRIQRLIEYMGGIFTKQLRSSVTHLIADSVMSAKYEGAIEMKIPIMTKEWIEDVWKVNLKQIQEVIKADDKRFDKHKCPVFMNLVATSTNLSKRHKEEIKRLIHDHGGTLMGPLDGTKVRVVLAPENSPMSDKLKFSIDNGIACLKLDWVYQSIKVGYALPFRNFHIKSVKACSTPEKLDTQITFNCSEISCIPYDKHNNFVNESLSLTSTLSTMDAVANNFSTIAMLNVLDKLTFSEAKLAGPFLDGCNIYLAGFTTSVRDKLNRILNVGGATRLDDISDAVTHVIVGDENKASAELKPIISRGLSPYVLSIEWLQESMKLKRPAPEECFLFEAKGGAAKKNDNETPASPLSKKNLQMLQRPKRPPVPAFNVEKEAASANEEQQSELVQQYLQETIEPNNTRLEFAKPRTSVLEDKNRENFSNVRSTRASKSASLEVSQVKDLQSDSTVPISQNYTEKFFKDLTFVVTGFNDEDSSEQEEMITALDGRIVTKTYSGIPDYGVVPVHGANLKHTVNEIVTDLFITDCINQEKIVEIMYYHRPILIRRSCNPLSGCVVTMSMYIGVERTYLSLLATKLGAICQDMFARKANAEKNTYGSTHLICPTPEGNKYNAAVRWKLPAVTADWVKACADQLTLVNETPFLVGETMVPDRSTSNTTNEINPTSSNRNETSLEEETTSRNILTPKRHISQIKGQEMISAETPLINKRLTLVTNKTPQSPFHVSTPDTPYGQVFKSNPSPDTRKGWIKWVDNFPDLQVAEPPLKRRAPSTPLSELKRQLWEKLKNPDQPEKENTTDMTVKLNDDSFAGKADEKEVDEQTIKNVSLTPVSVNRKLNFTEENSPVPHKPNNEINLQIAQLDQVLQRTSSTPEHRSLSGESVKKYDVEGSDHIQNCIVKDSQPVDAIVWEDPIQSTTRKFMLSGIKSKNELEEVIRKLGGEVSTDTIFDNSATHLLCIRPARNEKMLGSIASGKWILHHSYLRDSEQEGRFLDEEKYEWGNPKSEDRIPKPNGEIEEAVAAAAYRWRLKLAREPDGSPFSAIVALLLISKDKYDQFKRLIEAGGGMVIQARPPYDTSPSGRRINHCFVNVKQMNQPIDWAMLASKGILCLQPQYLSDYLTATSPLNPRDCVLPEFKKYLTLLPK